MIETEYRRILILGQPFNNYTGGGITLSNLFKGWPKEKIAILATGHSLSSVTTDICDTYYQLGKEEHKWKFPFNLLQKPFSSGQLSLGTQGDFIRSVKQTGIRHIIVEYFFYPLLKFAGLYHCLSKIYLSQKLQNWIINYKPEIFYIQVSKRETILFANELIDYIKIPSVIHMMDDWPSTISTVGLFKKYWRKKIDKEFKELLVKVNLHLSISNAMTYEYMQRYKIEFKPFHNPIDINIWRQFHKTNFLIKHSNVKILYAGRIGPGITESLIEVSKALDILNFEGNQIKLYIQSPSKDLRIINKLKKQKCVVINPIVDYEKLPYIFSQADILLIANDFNKRGISFLRYSIPTKLSEYMISGTPILVYSPPETAVSKFVSENNCGYCITEQNIKKIGNAVNYLLSNEELRKTISRNAVNIAKELFDADKVRKKFQELLLNLFKGINVQTY